MSAGRKRCEEWKMEERGLTEVSWYSINSKTFRWIIGNYFFHLLEIEKI